MLPVKNDLSENCRQNIVNLLQKKIYDGIDLMHQAKQAHWNVKGANFFALHELFDKIHEDVEGGVDLIAERIVQLGGIAQGTSAVVSKNSSLPTYPLTITEGTDHIESLSSSLAEYARTIRQGIEEATEGNDAGTADILTEISRSSDKNLWLVESHMSPELRKSTAVKGVA